MSLLYTIVPPEQVWGEDAPGEAAAALIEVTYHGTRLLARRTTEGAVIERLLTTDPNTYLDPGLNPGTPLPGVLPEA